VSSGVRFLVRLRCISSAVCALRTRWPQRALRPLLWDRPRPSGEPALLGFGRYDVIGWGRGPDTCVVRGFSSARVCHTQCVAL